MRIVCREQMILDDRTLACELPQQRGCSQAKRFEKIDRHDEWWAKKFSPCAAKAGTAQGEEEGEGIYDAYPYSNLYG